MEAVDAAVDTVVVDTGVVNEDVDGSKEAASGSKDAAVAVDLNGDEDKDEAVDAAGDVHVDVVNEDVDGSKEAASGSKDSVVDEEFNKDVDLNEDGDKDEAVDAAGDVHVDVDAAIDEVVKEDAGEHVDTTEEVNVDVHISPWELICDSIWPRLSLAEVKALAIVSSAIHLKVLPMMENDCYFKIPHNLTPTTLSPKKVICDIKPLLLPSIQHIRIMNSTQALIPKMKDFPPGLTHLEILHRYIECELDLPSTLTHLTFSTDSQHMHLLKLPSSLTHLILGEYTFNLPIFPPCLQQFELHSPYYLHQITLPNSVTTVYLPRVPPILPTSLIEAKFEFVNDMGPVYYTLKSLPDTLKKLTLVGVEDTLDYIPPSLTSLEVTGKGFFVALMKDLAFVKPRLTHLELHPTDEWKYEYPTDALPSTLKTLIIHSGFNGTVNSLPSNLTRLHLGKIFNQPLDQLPASLTELKIESPAFNQPLHKLPKSLTTLDLTCSHTYAHSIRSLPPSLTQLRIDGGSDFSIRELPDSLSSLTCSTTKPLTSLPSKLLILDLSIGFYDSPLDKLPPSLVELSLPYIFCQPLLNLPNSLAMLTFGTNLNNYAFIGPILLPRNLVEVHIRLFSGVVSVSRSKFIADIQEKKEQKRAIQASMPNSNKVQPNLAQHRTIV